MVRWCWLGILATACSAGVEPSATRVLVRQHRASTENRSTTATIQGNVLIVRGQYGAGGGCRVLRGAVEEKPGVLKLEVIGTAPKQPCANDPGPYDYEARVGPLPPGAFQLTVITRPAELVRRPLAIALRTDLRVE
jgi:hypothetical protein